MNATTLVAVIGALGFGGIIQALISYFKDRKKNVSDSAKTDVETKLAYLNAVIERLDAEAKRSLAELTGEQQRNSQLRARVRELEDELDALRRTSRETQHKCDELSQRLKSLLDDQDPQ